MPALIDERFAGPLDPRLSWLNEPPRWSTGDGLELFTASGSDFWQRTHYGFRADNGHFLSLEADGDFTLETRVHFEPANHYDQAGLMVRFSPDDWLKTSVEFEPEGPARLGAVVTRAGWSDWSTQDFPRDLHDIELRVRREHLTYITEWRLPAGAWTQLRVAPLTVEGPVRAGIYACSPKGVGFRASFAWLRLA